RLRCKWRRLPARGLVLGHAARRWPTRRCGHVAEKARPKNLSRGILAESQTRVTMFYGSESVTHAVGADRNFAATHRPMAGSLGSWQAPRRSSAHWFAASPTSVRWYAAARAIGRGFARLMHWSSIRSKSTVAHRRRTDRLFETKRRDLRQHRLHRLRRCCLFSDPRKNVLIGLRPMTAGSTDD